MIFTVTGFTGYYPVGTAAVVVAEDLETAKSILLESLTEKGLVAQQTQEWEIKELDPTEGFTRVILLNDGNY